MRNYLRPIGFTIVSAVFSLALTTAGFRVGTRGARPRADVYSVNHTKTTVTPLPGISDLRQNVQIGDILTARESLSYEGYTIERFHKSRKINLGSDDASSFITVDVFYARLQRHGTPLRTFDANLYSGYGNALRFGLFPLLGGSKKQLIVSQDVPRGGAQWIASLSPTFQLLFDGPRWRVGREGDDMKIVDLDHDSVYEIIVPITDFYDFQDQLTSSEIPLPEIIFKYDKQAGSYLPANALFPDQAFPKFGGEQPGTPDPDESKVRSRILSELLSYVYSGREDQAWSFFAREYRLADKREFQQRVKSILNNEPVYKFIYRRRQGSRKRFA